MRLARAALVTTLLVALGTAAGWLALGRDAVPRPVFTRVPAAQGAGRTARFAYRVDLPRPRFACALDGGRWEPCRSGRRLRGLADGAHRFCVRARSGRRRSGTACYRWTVGRSTGTRPFRMTATAAAALLPGAAPVPVDIAFANPGPSPITVVHVRLVVAAADPAGCARFIRVVGPLAAQPVIPAGATRSLSQLGVPSGAWPHLAMVDDGTNQDACRGAAIRLSLDGRASG